MPFDKAFGIMHATIHNTHVAFLLSFPLVGFSYRILVHIRMSRAVCQYVMDLLRLSEGSRNHDRTFRPLNVPVMYYF